VVNVKTEEQDVRQRALWSAAPKGIVSDQVMNSALSTLNQILWLKEGLDAVGQNRGDYRKSVYDNILQ